MTKTRKPAERVNDMSQVENAIYWMSRCNTYAKGTTKRDAIYKMEEYARLTHHNKGRVSEMIEQSSYMCGRDSLGQLLSYQLFDDKTRVGGKWIESRSLTQGPLLAAAAMGGFRRGMFWKDCHIARVLGCVGQLYSLYAYTGGNKTTRQLAARLNAKHR